MSIEPTPRHTPLYPLHLELGAKMTPFAGYAMPLHYGSGIIQEHVHTRTQASLFDVSHMGLIAMEGPATALEALVPSDIGGLGLWQQRYSVLTNEHGGIRDDLMITRLSERLSLVVNAAFKTEDFAYLQANLPSDCALRLNDDRALLALQGPAAAAVLATFDPRIAELNFMTAGEFMLAGIDCLVNRAGYTGEDGFEIALPASGALVIARALLADPRVAPAGLGARDSLRLEAGFCLAGADLDATTTPIEAGLSWTIAKKYRDRTVTPRFPGATVILDQLVNGGARVRVGVRSRGRIPLRGGVILHGADGTVVGKISSGGFGPTVNAPVAMGYVAPPSALAGTPLRVTIRDKEHVADVVSLPFVPHRYHQRGP
jgi:aminomethyltransferase